jgi:hypothetical protein
MVVGPIMGGGLAVRSAWVGILRISLGLSDYIFQRWIFWINLPICTLGALSLPALLKSKPPQGTLKDQVWRKDWLGSIIFIASLTSLLIPITWVGQTISP